MHWLAMRQRYTTEPHPEAAPLARCGTMWHGWSASPGVERRAPNYLAWHRSVDLRCADCRGRGRPRKRETRMNRFASGWLRVPFGVLMKSTSVCLNVLSVLHLVLRSVMNARYRSLPRCDHRDRPRYDLTVCPAFHTTRDIGPARRSLCAPAPACGCGQHCGRSEAPPSRCCVARWIVSSNEVFAAYVVAHGVQERGTAVRARKSSKTLWSTHSDLVVSGSGNCCGNCCAARSQKAGQNTLKEGSTVLESASCVSTVSRRQRNERRGFSAVCGNPSLQVQVEVHSPCGAHSPRASLLRHAWHSARTAARSHSRSLALSHDRPTSLPSTRTRLARTPSMRKKICRCESASRHRLGGSSRVS